MHFIQEIILIIGCGYKKQRLKGLKRQEEQKGTYETKTFILTNLVSFETSYISFFSLSFLASLLLLRKTLYLQ
jgi:hypothetical protein